MKKGWMKKIEDASVLEARANSLLQEVLVEILEDKGIESQGFFVCMATGGETVVHLDDDSGCKGGISDLDLCIMENMTRKEILHYFGI